jgi:hypothetical protein
LGGPQAKGASLKATHYATIVAATFNQQQSHVVRRFVNNELSLLIFTGMLDSAAQELPPELPNLSELEQDFHCLRLASRSQILLHIIEHRAFAYDIDNHGKLVRLVGNFKGGGKTKIKDEKECNVELSSHSGLALGAHTEAPYNCSIKSCDGHSPAPSVLILTARWNPENEPTNIIPMHNVIEKIGVHHALALTSKAFNFTRSDSFTAGQGHDGKSVSILDVDDDTGSFALRYNSYRFSVKEEAPTSTKRAFQHLLRSVQQQTNMVAHSLQPTTAMVINNCRALHCRDEVKDNRRLLIRLFGYARTAEPIVLSDDPLLVQG